MKPPESRVNPKCLKKHLEFEEEEKRARSDKIGAMLRLSMDSDKGKESRCTVRWKRS